jgi:hypothetical protein
VSRRLAHEAKAGKVALLVLDLLILLWARGVIIGEVEVAQGSTRSRHDLLELLLLFVPEVVHLLIVTLAAEVIPVDVVVLVGGVELLLLGLVDDDVDGVVALEVTPRWSPPFLVKPLQGLELHH